MASISDTTPGPQQESLARNSRVIAALDALDKAVHEQEARLKQLRKSVGVSPLQEPSVEPAAHLRQLQTIKVAYEALGASEPELPAPDSPLQELLALRGAHQVAKETRESISTVQTQLRESQRRLEKEQADLQDGRRITDRLQGRLDSLRHEERARAAKTPEQAARELITALRARRKTYNRDVKRLIQSFNWFVDTHLAAMLATEEQGGPVVGERIDIDEEALRHTFAAGARGRPGPNGEEDDSEVTNVLDSAAKVMRELTEDLLNASVSADGSSSSAYVTLPRDSAAVRFLVRAKIAQFAPRDARKLRLVDFGKRLDD